jgi:hypothetical protein
MGHSHFLFLIIRNSRTYVSVCLDAHNLGDAADNVYCSCHCQNLGVKTTTWNVNCRSMMLLMPLIEEAAALPILREFLIFPSHCVLFLVSSGNSVKLGNVVMVKG